MLNRVNAVRKAIRELAADENSLVQLGLWETFCAMENAAIDIETKLLNVADESTGV